MDTPLTIPDSASYQSALDFVFGRLNYERAPNLAKPADLKLERMEQLLAALGNPQCRVPTIHIAGSKGKGSTATMTASILQAAGFQTGLFTSPHIGHYAERFRIDGKTATHTEVSDYIARIRPIVEQIDAATGGHGPTFFEITTAIGWLHFAEHAVDYAVIEVGMGGRLDSTNICQPLVTCITTISKDHTRLLGETEDLIAAEKAGIIKPGIPVICGVQHPLAQPVIHRIAQQRNAPLKQLGRDFVAVGECYEKTPYLRPPRYHCGLSIGSDHYAPLELLMPGEHQVGNAALAVMIARELVTLGEKIGEQQIRSGLSKAHSPLRVEVFSQQPLCIVDVAHNSASINALCHTLKDVDVSRRTAVISISKDKDVADLLKTLATHFDRLILTQYQNNPRAVNVDELQQLLVPLIPACNPMLEWEIQPTPALAIQSAFQHAENRDLICIAGSFFLAAEAADILRER